MRVDLRGTSRLVRGCWPFRDGVGWEGTKVEEFEKEAIQIYIVYKSFHVSVFRKRMCQLTSQCHDRA